MSLRNFCAALAYYLYNSWITHVPSYGLRHMYLRHVLGFSLGKGVAVHMGCFFTGRKIRIGAGTVLNRNCYLDGRAGLTLGEHVSVSPECYLVSLGHDVQSPEFAAAPGPVAIGDRCWLGARAMILPGVHMAEGAVAGAGAVVTRSCEPFAILAGVPARKVGERNKDLNYRLAYFPWFNSDILP